MANINVRSPYFINEAFQTASPSDETKMRLYLKVYGGTQQSLFTDNSTADYTLSSSYVSPTQDASFEISDIVAGFLSTGFDGTYSTENKWVDWKIYEVDGGTETFRSSSQDTAFYGYGYFEEGANPQNNGFNTPDVNTILDSSFSPDVYNDWDLSNVNKASWIPGDKSNLEKNGFIRKIHGLSGTSENFLQETITSNGDLLDKSWWAHFHFQARSDVYNHLAFRVLWNGGSGTDKRVVLNIATQNTVEVALNQFEDDEVRLTNMGQIAEFANMWRLSVKVNPVAGETERLLRIHPATYNASGAYAPINNSSTYQYIGMCYLTEKYTSEPIFAYKRNSASSDYDIKFEDDWIGFSTKNIYLPEEQRITVPFIRNNDYNFTGAGFGLHNSDGTWTYVTDPTPSTSEADEVVVYETYNDLQAIHSGERIYKIHYVCEPKYTPRKITFVNKYGVLEDLWFFKASKKSMTTEGETFRGNIVNNGSYNRTSHVYKTFNKTARESMVINSGWYPESHNEAFKQLLLSEQVWINLNGRTLPVVIETDRLELKESINSRLISYTIELDFAFDEVNNIR